MIRPWLVVTTLLFTQLAPYNARSGELAQGDWIAAAHSTSSATVVASNEADHTTGPEEEPGTTVQEKPAKDQNSPWWIRGRLVGYQGKWPFYIAAMVSRDFSDPANPIAWVRVNEKDGLFDIPITQPGVNSVYLLGQLDKSRKNARAEFQFSGGILQFVRRLPVHRDDVKGKRLLIDVEGVELAHHLLEHGTWIAIGIALGLAFILYGVGFLIVRRLRPTARGDLSAVDPGGWPLWLIAFGTTLPLLPTLGSEALELLEFTYLHEGVRPESILSLLSDQISAELSHPPLWPLLMRAFASISHAEWWLRLPSILCHVGYVFVMYRVGYLARCKKTGLLTALVGGCAPIAFYYAQDATPYALLALISAGTTLCILEERWKTFALLIVAGFFTHYTVAVLAIAIAFSLLWAWRKTRDNGWLRRVFRAYAIICVLPLFWSVHFIVTFFASGLATRRMSLDYLPDTGFFDYVSHFLTIAVGLPPELLWCTPIALLIIGYGAYACTRDRPVLGRLISVQAVSLFAYILFVYSMYMYFAGGRVFYAYRWTTVFLPALAICTAYGLMSLGQLWKPLGIAAGVVVIGGALMQDARIAVQHKRPDQHAARALIEHDSKPGDAFCALPAIYYGQLFNYVLANNYPDELLAWPAYHGNLYGPLHPRNSTLETLATNLAFRRLWVADFHEEMFGTAKFDSELADHQLEWMKENLLFNPKTDMWRFPKLTLYRFDVPNEPQALERRAWKDEKLSLDFSKRIQLFRHFPDLLHSQETGRIMIADAVRVRVPSPPFLTKDLQLTIRMNTGKLLTAADLTVNDQKFKFAMEKGWGVWKGLVPVTEDDRLDIHLRRSKRATEHHLNTILTLKRPETK